MDTVTGTPREGGIASVSGAGPRQFNATEKVLAVLEELSRDSGPFRLGDIAARAKVGKASTHRILADLVESRFADSDGAGCYSSGPRLLALSSGIVEQRNRGRSVLSTLTGLQRAAGQTVHFAVLSGFEAVYVHKVESEQPFQMASRVGMRVPLYCTAVGKSILANLPESQLHDYLGAGVRAPRTSNTLTTERALRAELKRVRKQGYAIDNEENEASIRCIGAPVFGRDGHVIGGVSVSTLTFALSAAQARALAPDVQEAAATLSEYFAPLSRREV